jgi:hypothetical protein
MSVQPTNQNRLPSHVEGELVAEIRRRLIQIHVALASATDDDREIRRSTLRRVMDLLNDIAPRDPNPQG